MDGSAPTVVVIGGSAGGVRALMELAAELPPDLAAAVCVVLHLRASAESHLAHIVARAGSLPALQARGGETLQEGYIYVAPPDHHLTVEDGHAIVERGPHENGFRPAIDALFRTAAGSYGRRTIAVVLSGARDDGVAGAKEVDAQGGCVFVQDPAEAQFPALPTHTISRDHPDRVLRVADLAPAIAREVERLSSALDA